MVRLFGLLPFLFARAFRSRRDLLLENRDRTILWIGWGNVQLLPRERGFYL